MNKQLKYYTKRVNLLSWLKEFNVRFLKSVCVVMFYTTTFSSINAQVYEGHSTLTYNSGYPITGTGYEDGILVSDGFVLILDHQTLNMNISAKITVEMGGQLIIQNGTTINFNGTNTYGTGSECGILCEGYKTYNGTFHPLDEQFHTFPNPSITNSNSAWEGSLLNYAVDGYSQTLVKVDNSTIKYAQYGIKSTYGGVVRVTNSTFEDCITAVDFQEWHSASRPEVNASYLMNSTFKWVHQSNNKLHLIKLTRVSGINIGGCTFTTQYGNPACDRGTGIFSFLSNFAVSQGGNSFCEGTEDQINGVGSTPPVTPKCLTNCMLTGTTAGCNFSNLDSAISFIGHPTNMKQSSLNVRFSTFTNNLHGIVMHYGRRSRIDNNTFNGNVNTMNGVSGIFGYCVAFGYPKIDILLVECSDYKIYMNKFNFDGNTSVPGGQTAVNHISVVGPETMTNSIIKNNDFNNSMISNISTSGVTGIKVEDINPGLEILCNTFSEMGTDILVGGSNTIKTIQKNGTSLNANNRFSALATGRNRLDNTSGTTINYTYDGTLLGNYDPLTLGVTRITQTLTEILNCTMTCEGYLVKVNQIHFNKALFTLYPNPVYDKLTIQPDNNLETIGVRKIGIYDINGKLMTTKEFSDDLSYVIDCSSFGVGMYLLKIEDNQNKIYTKKFIIQ